jgi:ribosomal protein S18 acetylase RimI-like enzyme
MNERQLTVPHTIERIEEKLDRPDINSIIGLIRMADPGRIIPHREQMEQLESLSNPEITETALFLARSAFQAVNYLNSDVAVVGFASTRAEGEGVSIENLFVHPMSRNRSLGRALVETCIDFAESKDARFVRVTNTRVSTAANRLFTGLDFTRDEQGLFRRNLR